LERFNTRADDREGKSENFDVILRRFFRDVQQSGILTEVKKRRFRTKDVSRSKKRLAAKRKAEVRKIKRGY
jgi:ribosomal protein S21